MKRSRSDLSTVILQQLTTPLGLTNVCAWTPLSEELADCSVILLFVYACNIILLKFIFKANVYQSEY